MHAVILALWCGCAEPLPPCAPSPDGYDALEVADLEPELDVLDVDAALSSAFAASAVWPLDFLDVWRGVTDDIARNAPSGALQEGCDAGLVESSENAGHLTAQCFSDVEISGRDYAMYGTWQADVAPDVTPKFADLLYSFHATRLSTGDAIVGGGHFFGIWTPTARDHSLAFTFQDRGTYLDEGASGALAHGVGVGTLWSGFWARDVGFSASFEGPIGTGTAAIDLHEVTLEKREGPGAAGHVFLRDPSGGWWDLRLDDDHSGCGTAHFSGREMGETCAGLTLATALDELFERGMEPRW